ncbi:MAG: GNAT family protein [Candidatus Omnitrophota bacterium]
MEINGKRIYLKILTTKDDLTNYLRWMNDSDIVRFTESKGKSYSQEDLNDYISAMSNDKNHFFGVYLNNDNRHIGNIKLGDINIVHKRADIGLIIGEKDLWGQGFGTEAIELLIAYAFKELNLRKVVAGMYADNLGSYKAFLKSGFKECGRLKDNVFLEGRFIDGILVEKINENYKSKEITKVQK